MIKKVKKIPKYNDGIAWADMNKTQRVGAVTNAVGTGLNMAMNSAGLKVTALGVISGAGQGAAVGAQLGGGWGAVIGAAGGALMSSIGRTGSVDENTGEMTDPSGILGMFGNSKDYLLWKLGQIKSSIASKQQTENLRQEYYSNPDLIVNPNINAAEGAIIRRPVDALVSKGELIYDPETKQLSKVPGSKGKPNKKDDVAVKLYEGDVVVSNSPTMLMANGKTPAQNLENMVTIDKKKGNRLSEGTIKAREAIIKKVVNWLEANKIKPQEYAMYDGGTNGVSAYDDDRIDLMSDDDLALYILAVNRGDTSTMNFLLGKYVIEKNVSLDEVAVTGKKPAKKVQKVSNLGQAKNPSIYPDFIKMDADGKPYKQSRDSVPNWRKTPTQQQIDIFRFGENYKDVQDNRMYVSPESNMDELIITAPKKNKDTKKKSTAKKTDAVAQTTPIRILDIGERHWLRGDRPGDAISESTRSLIDFASVNPITLKNEKLIAPPLKKVSDLMDTYNEDINDAYKTLRRNKLGNNISPKIGEAISDYAPLASALFGDYDYHSEQAYINPAKYMPINVGIEPIRRAADESYALARYNQANINPNTGAGMAYGLQAATNRAKTLSDAYQWQTEQQNKLIAQNVGIYNDWASREAQARHTANTETRQNEAAADYMRRTDIKSGLNWAQQRRRDRQLLPAYKQYLKYGMLEDTLKGITV